MENEGPDPTIRYLQGKFAEYYRGHEPDWPPRFGAREWAFFLWDGKGMLRHTGFVGLAKLRQFLGRSGPRHVYYSSAYYQRPSAPTMPQKGWLGADLIFDIDADHIKGAEKMTYREMLDKVKEEIMKLVCEYLMREFFFEENDMQIVFSGGRGYHVHVRDPRVWELNSHERMEIVNYIMATDLDTQKLYNKVTVTLGGSKEHPTVLKKYIIPDSHDWGWRGRFSGSIKKYVTKLEKMDKEKALADIMEVDGIGKQTAEKIYNILYKPRSRGPRGFERIINENTVELFDKEGMRNTFTKLIIEKTRVYAGEADAPVTKDINRLIRLPGSLHGKSSLRVVPLTFKEMEAFDPLISAVAFGDEPLKVILKKDLKFEIKGNKYDLKAGPAELPQHAAIFLMARGEATIDEGN